MTRVTLERADAALHLALRDIGRDSCVSTVFILGAPRTGSTYLYQAMCAALELPYISNLTNDCFATCPIVGLAIQRAVMEQVTVDFSSSYGKTDGDFQPSEGSNVMRRWFGGRQPAQRYSTRVLPGREVELLSVLSAGESLFRAPMLIKNAWNCFRVPYLACSIPRSRFVWVRRDVVTAARSDLEARMATKNDVLAWNSAEPSNVAKLRRLPPWAQVVENQLEFASAVEAALRTVPDRRWTEVWYEDLLSSPETVIRRLGEWLGVSEIREQSVLGSVKPPRPRLLSPQDSARIEGYVDTEACRMNPLRWRRA